MVRCCVEEGGCAFPTLGNGVGKNIVTGDAFLAAEIRLIALQEQIR